MLLSTAFLLGLVGSFHCLAMCAPITWAMPDSDKKRSLWLAGKLTYNGGRIITYAVLGGLAGGLGSTFAMAGWQQGLSVSVGVLMLGGVLAFGMDVPDKVLTRPLMRLISWVRRGIGRLMHKKSLGTRLMLGMLNGLLPCGLVYAAMIAAMSMGSLAGGAAYMTLFGLGTLPMLLTAAVFGKLINQQLRQKAWHLASKMVAIVGLLFILRGLNLGIPYLSPRISDNMEVTECARNNTGVDFVSIVEEK